MARLSNAQGLLFAEISTEEIHVQGPPVATLKGWFGAQQVGQIKSLVTNTVNEQKGVVTHTVGDSILSSFADAGAALSAALGIQRRVAKAQNPHLGEPNERALAVGRLMVRPPLRQVLEPDPFVVGHAG